VSGLLLDTNIPSEAMKPRPEPKVERWLDEVEDEQLFFSVISLA
jgi:predicted nucleic acid-binding protein